MISRERLATLRNQYRAAKDAGKSTVTVSTWSLGMLCWAYERERDNAQKEMRKLILESQRLIRASQRKGRK